MSDTATKVIGFKKAFNAQSMAGSMPLPCESEGAREMLQNSYASILHSGSLILPGDLTETIRGYFNRQVQYFTEFDDYACDYLQTPVTPRLLCAYIAIGNCITRENYYTHPEIVAGIELARKSEKIGYKIKTRRDLRNVTDTEERTVIFLRHLSAKTGLDVAKTMSDSYVTEFESADQLPRYVRTLRTQSGYMYAKGILWPESDLTDDTNTLLDQVSNNFKKIRAAAKRLAAAKLVRLST